MKPVDGVEPVDFRGPVKAGWPVGGVAQNAWRSVEFEKLVDVWEPADIEKLLDF
ncbi:hypothetical protein NG798_26500 [Ancylothrix sp. C2]|uniref:hypothetical protein n=1 Tax=Ancylothrix sp. D3o TaxID=2953691 RepID=UPI0021BB9858|nr:hypothetical protein [Ancylothrix sp. D3o]MCT7953354.1 hypothetical protein [Ancylothrix sp. D3o]